VLHGGNEPREHKSWTAFTGIEAFTADKNVLVVLPSDAPAGCCTDTYDPVRLPNAPKWEIYHTVELPPNHPAGLPVHWQQRGRGPLHRRLPGPDLRGPPPGMYQAAASYSGLTNTFDFTALVAVTNSRIQSGSSPRGSLGHPPPVELGRPPPDRPGRQAQGHGAVRLRRRRRFRQGSSSLRGRLPAGLPTQAVGCRPDPAPDLGVMLAQPEPGCKHFRQVEYPWECA
jgi:hypothetical protein